MFSGKTYASSNKDFHTKNVLAFDREHQLRIQSPILSTHSLSFLYSKFTLKKNITLLFIFITCISFTIIYNIHQLNFKTAGSIQYQLGISQETFRQGLLKCEKIKREKPDNSKLTRTKNPRYTGDSKIIVLKNALILDGVNDDVIEDDLSIRDGIIKSVGRNETDNYLKKMKDNGDEIVIIDLKKKFVSPGLVDMHRYHLLILDIKLLLLILFIIILI